jgi:hypothetical protein
MAKQVKKVVGIEMIQEAVQDAQENAKINGTVVARLSDNVRHFKLRVHLRKSRRSTHWKNELLARKANGCRVSTLYRFLCSFISKVTLPELDFVGKLVSVGSFLQIPR